MNIRNTVHLRTSTIKETNHYAVFHFALKQHELFKRDCFIADTCCKCQCTFFIILVQHFMIHSITILSLNTAFLPQFFRRCPATPQFVQVDCFRGLTDASPLIGHVVHLCPSPLQILQNLDLLTFFS